MARTILNSGMLVGAFRTAINNMFTELYGLIGKVPGINDQSGTAYTLVLADAGYYVRCSNAAAIALTVPANADVAFPVGSVVTIEQGDAGVVTVAGDVGVTVNAYNNGFSSAGQFATLQLMKTGTDTWTLIGGTT